MQDYNTIIGAIQMRLNKCPKNQNLLMDKLYKMRMSGMAEAFENQLMNPNSGSVPSGTALRSCGASALFLRNMQQKIVEQTIYSEKYHVYGKWILNGKN